MDCERLGFWVGTWNVDSLTGRAGEVIEALSDRKVDTACIQETRAPGQRYKLFWMGGEERSDGVGTFVAEKWVDSLVSVGRHGKRALILRMVLDNGLLNVLMVYASHSEKPVEEKRVFGMKCSTW